MSVIYLHYSYKEFYSLFLTTPGRKIPSYIKANQKVVLLPVIILMLLMLYDCAVSYETTEQPVSLVKPNLISNFIKEVL
jgi:hypothetical protein